MIFLLLATQAVFAATPLQELKKQDYSILLRDPTPAKEIPQDRCFLLPQVNQALSRVQQRMRVLQAGIRVSRCYEAGDARYGKGAAVEVALAQEGKVTPRQFIAALKAEGFREAGKGKGIFVHEASEASAIQSTPVAELP